LNLKQINLKMSRRMTTTGDQADMLRLRKELIQSKSQI
jgi:hypothetical protein